MRRLYTSIFLAALAAAGSPAAGQPEHPDQAILGADDRVPVNDPAVARIVTVGCTGWLVSNGAFLTAGHCVTDAAPVTCPTPIIASFTTVQFNVPLSESDGAINNPPAEDQYPILRDKIQCEKANSGSYTKDWAVFAVGTNSSGQYPVENQKAFYRMTNRADLLEANASLVRVTGYGVDGPPPEYGQGRYAQKNKYNKTEQTAADQYLGVFSFNGYINLRYLVDTSSGNSGSPVMLNGSTFTLGIHAGAGSQDLYNAATSFQLPSLAGALQAFPGTLESPVIPGSLIFYVDAFSPAYVSTPTGTLFTPFPTLTQAFNKLESVPPGTASMISIVAGGYPETIDSYLNTSSSIWVTLNGDATLVMPVGVVTLWGTVQVPSSGPTID